jgi:hypothetical protein
VSQFELDRRPERGISKALGRTRSGSHWQKKREQGAELPLYLTANNIKPFISNDLIKALSEPRWYRSPHGGRPKPGPRGPYKKKAAQAA